MSYRKTKLIQERNILLERKHLLEQAPPPPPPSNVTTQQTTPGVTTNTTTLAQSVTTTTTTSKITKDTYKNLSLCSSVKNPENPEEIKTEFGVVLKDPKGKLPYCRKE